MSWYAEGEAPINSTGDHAPVSAPSTSTLIAEIDSTQLGTVNFTPGQTRKYRCTVGVGADSNATWKFEQVPSTALTTSTHATCWFLKSPPSQTAQYVINCELGRNDRLRIRMDSTQVNACGWIQAEPLI